MKTQPINLSAKVWLYNGASPWHFVTIPKKEAELLKKEYIWPRRGFGSIPVEVTINKIKWKTSVFPDKEGAFLLPIKKQVREKAGIKINDTVKIAIVVLI